MRVVVVNHSSAADHLGGSELSLLRLMDDWAASRAGLEPIALTRSPAGLFVREWERRGWAWEEFPFQGWLVPSPFDHAVEREYYELRERRAAQMVVSAVRRLAPSLVITNTMVVPWGAVGARIAGVPHAWFVREFGNADHGMHFVHGETTTLSGIGALSDAVFANSRAVADFLRPHIDPIDPIVIYPVVDASAFDGASSRPANPEPFPHETDLRVAVTGRVTASKGQWRVVDAIGHLREQGITVSACFVGAVVDAEHDRTLIRRAKDWGVADHIVLAGEQVDPAPFISRADVCVTPSSHEAFGRTTLEYLWASKPVVAMRAGGSPELVTHEINGFLVDGADTGALARSLAAYVRNPSLIRRHGDAGYRRAQQFASPDHSNARAIAVLESLTVRANTSASAELMSWLEATPQNSAAFCSRVSLTVRLLAHRIRIKATRLMRDPIGVIRRRLPQRNR